MSKKVFMNFIYFCNNTTSTFSRFSCSNSRCNLWQSLAYSPTQWQRCPLHHKELMWGPFIDKYRKVFYVLLNVHLSIIFVNKPNRCTIFSYIFISILYMFRSPMCPSSGELILSTRHLVYVTLCRWRSGMHTRRSSTQSDIY